MAMGSNLQAMVPMVVKAVFAKRHITLNTSSAGSAIDFPAQFIEVAGLVLVHKCAGALQTSLAIRSASRFVLAARNIFQA